MMKNEPQAILKGQHKPLLKTAMYMLHMQVSFGTQRKEKMGAMSLNVYHHIIILEL